MTLQEKIDKRVGLIKAMRSLIDTANAEVDSGKRKAQDNGDPLNGEEQAKYAQMEKDESSLKAQIDRESKLGAAEDHLRNQRDGAYRADVNAGNGGASSKRGRLAAICRPEYRDAFEDGFLRFGKAGMEARHFNVLQEGADADGGFLVPEEYENQIIKKLYEVDPIRQYANVQTSSSDRNIPVRTGIPVFAWLGENQTYGSSNPAYGNVLLQAHKCGGEVPISEELLQDSMVSMEGEISETAALAFAEIESTGFGSGNGAGKPQGLWTYEAVGSTSIQKVPGLPSATPKYTPDDFIDLYHKLPVPYRSQATWLMHDDGVKLARKMKSGLSGDQTYIWQPGLVAGQPDTILGRPVVTSKGGYAPAISGKSILFGNLKAYRIQDRLGISMKRLNELHALIGQIGFLFTKRTDGRLTDGNALVYFEHGAAS